MTRDYSQTIQSEEYPLVSLLVCMHNEAGYIERCLESILRQDYPASRFEVYILDGQSKDRSWQIVNELIQGRPGFHLVSNSKIIQSAGWNLGIQLSHGEIIGIVSAHAELAPDYLTTAVQTLKRTGADMVGGLTRAKSTGDIGEAIAIATSTPFGVGGGRFHYTEFEEEVDTVFMGLCKRVIYQRIGGFDEEMVRDQDDELSYRLQKNHGRIMCNPEIHSTYYSRSTLGSLWRQYFQYGFYKVRVLQKHTRQMRLRQFVPPTFAAALLISTLLTIFTRPGWILLTLVAGSYLLANLAASHWTASKKGWKYLPLLPVVYAILHLSYGLGFLVGLVKFANRWGDQGGKVPIFQENLSSSSTS